MNKNFKKLVSVLFTIAIIASMANVVFANSVPGMTATTRFQKPVEAVLGLVQYVGFAFAVGMLLYIGIKYMMASANEKADLKKGAINYVIGAVLVFGASFVVGFLKDFAGDLQ